MVQSPESAILAGRRVRERDVAVQRAVLEAGRALDRRDDLARDAELRERAEARVLVDAVVADRLVEADQPLLLEVLAVAAGQEVARGLEADEAVVAADQGVERPSVAVPRPQDECEIVRFALRTARDVGMGLMQDSILQIRSVSQSALETEIRPGRCCQTAMETCKSFLYTNTCSRRFRYEL